MAYKITVGTANRPIQKVITYNTKTNSLHKEPHYPSTFLAKTVQFDNLKQLGTLIKNAKDSQFIIHGHMDFDKIKVVPKAQLKDGQITRSLEYFKYNPGEPAVFMIDIDGDDDLSPDAIHDMLCDLSPAFNDAEFIAIPSSSSNIFLKDKPLTQTKWHLYFLAENGSDIPRFTDALFQKAIIRGYGKAFITKAGTILPRTFFDKAVLSPERIDFIGSATVTSPLTQKLQAYQYNPGTPIDTRLIKTPASDKKNNEYRAILKEILTDPAVIEKAKLIQVNHHDNLKADLIAKSRIPLTDKEAEEIVLRKLIPADDGQFYLHEHDFVEFEDDESIVTVHDIRNNPTQYLNRSVRDPQEPDYGTGKALLRISHGKVYITSQAHGGNRRFFISGRTFRDFDNENRRFYLGGMTINQDFLAGGWQRLNEKVCTIQTTRGIDVVLRRENSNSFRPIPERGKQPHFREDPYKILPFETWAHTAFPKSLSVLYDYEINAAGDYKPVYKPIGSVINDLDWLKYMKTGGFCFEHPSEYITKNYFNLYEGFAVEQKKGDCSPFYELIDLIIFETEEDRVWFLDYFAQLIQEPFNKPGTGVILMSGQGAGKNMILELIGRLMPLHYYSTPVLDELFKFNINLAGKLLINLDEATFGGDGRGGQHLKSIVTGHSITVERKFKDAEEIRNNLRFVITTNTDHPIPVELDDRRWAVYRMNRLPAEQREQFFGRIANWYNGGGAEALLYELRERVITSDLSNAPLSVAKQSIQEHSMSADLSFIKRMVETGFVPRYDGLDEQELNIDRPNKIMLHMTHNSFKEYAKHEYGSDRFTKTKISFARKIVLLFPGSTLRGRGRDNEFLQVPPLKDMRRHWEKNYGRLDVSVDEMKLPKGSPKLRRVK